MFARKSKRRNEMLLIFEKSVFQKSLERSCFEDLAAVFSPVFSFLQGM